MTPDVANAPETADAKLYEGPSAAEVGLNTLSGAAAGVAIGGALLKEGGKAALKELGKEVFEEVTGIPTDVGDVGKVGKKDIGKYAPDRKLPRDKHGNPIPESDAPHTQLGKRTSKKTGETYNQGREFGKGGEHVRDIDFTSHGRKDHPNPLQHKIDPETGKRGGLEPLNNN
jgi:hypothetical protein